jgi:hypothetical protein
MLGIGAGYQPYEFERFGVDRGSPYIGCRQAPAIRTCGGTANPKLKWSQCLFCLDLTLGLMRY